MFRKRGVLCGRGDLPAREAAALREQLCANVEAGVPAPGAMVAAAARLAAATSQDPVAAAAAVREALTAAVLPAGARVEVQTLEVPPRPLRRGDAAPVSAVYLALVDGTPLFVVPIVGKTALSATRAPKALPPVPTTTADAEATGTAAKAPWIPTPFLALSLAAALQRLKLAAAVLSAQPRRAAASAAATSPFLEAAIAVGSAPAAHGLPPLGGLPLACMAVPVPAGSALLGGADCMGRGVVAMQPAAPGAALRGGTELAVSVLGNPVPFATGIVDTDDFAEGFPPVDGTAGAALRVVCCFGDELWKQYAPEFLAATTSAFWLRPLPPAAVDRLRAPLGLLDDAAAGGAASEDEAPGTGSESDGEVTKKKKKKPVPKAARGGGAAKGKVGKKGKAQPAEAEGPAEATTGGAAAQLEAAVKAAIEAAAVAAGPGARGALPPGFSGAAIAPLASPAAATHGGGGGGGGGSPSGSDKSDGGSEGDGAAGGEESEAPEDDAPVFEPDEAVTFALCEAVSRLDRAALPVAVNEFVGGPLLACLPDAGPGTEPTAIDWAATSFKKPLAFLKRIGAGIAAEAKGKGKGKAAGQAAGSDPARSVLLTLEEASAGVWRIARLDKAAAVYRAHRRAFHASGRIADCSFAAARAEEMAGGAGGEEAGDAEDAAAFLGVGTAPVLAVHRRLRCAARETPAFRALALLGVAVPGGAAGGGLAALGDAPTLEEAAAGTDAAEAAEAAGESAADRWAAATEFPEFVEHGAVERHVKAYARAAGLVLTAPAAAAVEGAKPGHIRLDAVLMHVCRKRAAVRAAAGDAAGGGSNGSSGGAPPVVAMAAADVAAVVRASMVEHTLVELGGGAEALSIRGPPPPVRLHLERRRNHYVTVVMGLHRYGARPAGLQAAWRPVLGAAVQLEAEGVLHRQAPADPAAPLNAIVVHGDARGRLERLLQRFMGLPAAVIETGGTEKKQKKRRRR